ncbi:SDR family oxidoreductase [Vibrio metschnikovii]|nr:SDR family oxidoreductase [Vibrio metschnikovii]
MPKSILLTGTTGFIGTNLVNALTLKSDLIIKSVVRRAVNEGDELSFEVGEINASTDYRLALNNTNIVIHCAARAHVASHATVDSLAQFRAVNTEGTLNLAQQAAEAGVKRFIFLSTIGVHGISNTKPFLINDTPAPVEDYAVSKLEAEIGLKKIAEETGMEVVIIRPPLVYGSNAPGNFGKLAKLASKNLPLPFGAVKNLRSLVAVDNLVDLIITCIDHPKAANQTFLVSDDHDVSTSELLHAMTLAAGKKPRLLPIPMSWLYLAGKLTGKKVIIDRLCGSLQVDINHTKEMLDWKPSVSFNDGIQKCFDKE